ncbi:MAG: hypothetical protein M3203_09685, partial [Actinomycetota bacterium]|nr:hypothetical protein [Actinomycetota bacterium]
SLNPPPDPRQPRPVLTYLQTNAMTSGEATVAVTVILAATALVLLVVWQLFGLARPPSLP